MAADASRGRRPEARIAGFVRGGAWGLALGAVAVVAVLSLGVALAAGGHRASRLHDLSASARHRIVSAYGSLPLSFEQNLGQANSRVGFLAHGSGFALGLTRTGPVLALYRGSPPVRAAGSAGRNRPRDSRASVRALSVGFVGGSTGVRLAGAGQLPGRVNYLIGNDRRNWHTDVPTFSGVAYRGAWRGIDATFSGSQHSFEYVFTVAAGADPRQILLRYHGQSGLRLDHGGNLLIAAGPGGSVRQLAPWAYQLIGGQRRSVTSRYVLTGSRVAIRLGAYDHTLPLVIDPTLDYSTYLGGTNNDYGTGIAVDASGSAYVTGYTSSTDFPTFPAPGAYQPANAGPGTYDAFVSKLKPDGSALVYSTYLGGGNADAGQGIAVDTAGSAYVTGYATSTDFPTTSGASQTTDAGNSDAFVSKLKPDGSGLVYSTYLGGDGEDIGYGIALDTAGSAYITGDTYSTNLPTTAGAYQTAGTGSRDAFVSKLKPDGSGLMYSTYLGGTGTDYGNAIAVDSAGSAYVTGYGGSTDFPTSTGAYQTANAGGVDAFVSKLKPDGSALVYSTYLGGTDRDVGMGIAVDAVGGAYITGATSSTGFPTTAGAYRTAIAGSTNAFVSKLKPDGSGLAYSTYVGGSQYDWGNGIAVDGSGSAYITGHTASPDFPTTPDAYQRTNGNVEAFVSKLSASGAALAYSTFLGGGGDEGLGIAIDAAGSAYITGNTYASGFPTTAGAYQPTLGGAYDGFVAKLTPPAPAKRATSTSVSCVPSSVTVGSASTCTATVSDTDAGAKSTPTGSVSFVSDSAGAFSNPGASCTLGSTGTAGVASCTVDYTPSSVGPGSHKITASYAGDSTHAASSGSANVGVAAVPKRSSSTGVSCVPSSVTVGSASTCTATVSDSDAGAKSTPTGTVSFVSDSAGAFSSPGASCSLAASGTVGVASCSVVYTPSAVGSGTHKITGSYGGDSTHSASSGSANLTVTAVPKRSTSTSVSCVPGSVTVGSASTCTATVPDSDAGAKSTPTGSVSFVSDSAGAFSNPGASCSLAATATPGVASCRVDYTPSSVGSGSHKITASYGGDSTHTVSNGSQTVHVQPAGPSPPPPGPPSGPPSATITTPVDGASYFFDSTVNANYSCSPGTNGGALKPGSAGCSGTVPDGSPIDTRTSGAHTFTVTATDTDGQTTTTTHSYTLNYNQPIPTPVPPQRPGRTVIVNPRVDIRVTGIEVNQAVQANTCNCAGTLPNRADPFANTPGRATYEGVTMAAGKYTIVRVFAHFTPVDVPTATTLRGATAQLRIFDSHEQEISPPLNPDISPAALTRPDCVACVSEDERANARAAFLFLVPWDETYHRSLSFRATVSPPTGLGSVVQCGGCNANVFTLRGVPFATTANVDIYPIPLTVGGVQTSQTEDGVFGSAQTALPVNLFIHPYEAPLAVDKLTRLQAAGAVYLRALSDGHVSFFGPPSGPNLPFPIGVFDASAPNAGGVTFGSNQPISVVRDNRPLTSVMHEIGHGLGLVHADTGSDTGGTGALRFTGQHPDGSQDCGGNSGGQVGEAWPPDQEGRIQGVGLDLRNWTARLLEENHPGLGSNYYDFMSYCPGVSGAQVGSVQENEADHWISVRNWSRLIAFRPPAQTLPAAIDAVAHKVHVASGPPLQVLATVAYGGATSILDVAPGQPGLAGSTAGSPYRFELRDAAGAELATAVPLTTSVHIDGERPGLMLEATLPSAPSAAAVVVSAGGVELARRARSAHAPTVVLLSPRRRTHIGRSARTLVRWRAHDADGDRLTTTVDYSADRGRHWIVVASTAGGDSARVPSRLLSASRNARLRIRVSDGFNVATATSGVLSAAGSRPVVRIIGGAPGGRVRADQMLLLRAEAFDDSGRQISGRRLAWYDGRRLLGHGRFLTARNLPIGNDGIQVVATDALGRSTRARLPLKVVAPPPTFLVARAPAHVAPRARRVRIVVASTVPATLAIGGRRYAVNRKPRAITISIRRGRSVLRLPYVLSGRGGALRGTYLALR